MNKATELKLIQGDFTAAEAHEILTNIFSSKIHFHEMRNYSSMERFGKEDEVAKKRIIELKQCIEDFKKVILEAESINGHVKINSKISLSLEQITTI